jgi:hypothetical protein
MKILRVRRGYTTNSSGSNEWVPPKHLKLTSDGGVGNETESLSVRILSGKGAGEWSQDRPQVTILAAQPGSAQTQTQTAGTTQPARVNFNTGKSIANLGLVGIAVGVVCLLFLGTAFLRRILGAKRKRDETR